MAEDLKKRVTYIHGDLDLHIIEARNLPNMDLLSCKRFRRCAFHAWNCIVSLLFRCFKARNISRAPLLEDGASRRVTRKIYQRPKIFTSDPYVTVCVPHTVLARTRVLPSSENPRWDQRFYLPLSHPFDYLEFKVKDDDFFGARSIGNVFISGGDIATGEVISGWFPIIGSYGKPLKRDAALRVEMKFIPINSNPIYKHGIAGDPEHKGVRKAYFPLRRGHSLTLYQDAQISPHVKLPQVELDAGKVYEHQHCWEDICYAISEANHLIYIMGWSIHHKVKLVREPSRALPRGGDLSLGELLKYKADEGVRVLVLAWDDRTSLNKCFLKTKGVMGVHDEETKKFFKNSSVTCVLAPRYASNKLGIIKQQIVGTVFSYHEKCLLVDTQAYGNNRKITAFLGGLDLRDGRYDTPEHRIFRDLDTVFRDDWYNLSFTPGTSAPRQPWHDLHCRIEGPAAYDVLINFAQRWKKATKWKEISLLKKPPQGDAMINIESISCILNPTFAFTKEGHTVIPEEDPELYVSGEDHSGNWHVQIFRSTDSGAVKGFPKYYDTAEEQNLIVSKKLVVDKSVQTAYIQAIRSAQHFIYIENQYFLGSSYAWPSYKDAGADHPIPIELALKIVNKIRARERFAVYVVIPLYPEGDPRTSAMQEILFWQYQTMQMMYKIIADELKSQQIQDAHPSDYLNFYCLGNREEIPSSVLQSFGDIGKAPDSTKFKRFMVYIHAKGMIVDDEYLILGSANINQRSMAGSKDTEIAMGAYQPHHTWSMRHQHPHGQIYGFRMSLWAEHTGELNECFKEPNTLECVKKMNEIGENNWMRYTADEFTLLQGHLMKYPVQVDADGQVNHLPGYENFPDVGGKICGTHSPTMPDILTT